MKRCQLSDFIEYFLISKITIAGANFGEISGNLFQLRLLEIFFESNRPTSGDLKSWTLEQKGIIS